MLGRIGCMLPEFIINRPGSWLGLSVYIERMTQRSSMHAADVRKQLADFDAAFAVRCELERRRHQVALRLPLELGGERLGQRLAVVASSASAWGRTYRRATARRS